MLGRKFLLVLVLFSYMHAYAGEGETAELKPVIVTAEKRSADIQDVAASVTSVSGEQADDFVIKNTMDIMSLVPNLYITKPGNSSMSFATLRGITGSFNNTPALGFYVDDIYYPSLDVNLYDIERIETVIGPQGNLYGRNSEAGIINIVTKKPSNLFEGMIGTDLSSFNTYEGKAAVSGPVVKDKLFFKGAVTYGESDGYFENRYDGSKKGGMYERTDARLSLRYKPDEKLDVSLTYDYQNYDTLKNTQFAPLYGGNLRKDMNMDEDGKNLKDANGLALRAEYIAGNTRIVSITANRNEKEYSLGDMDFSPYDIMTMSFDKDFGYYSQEFRFMPENPSGNFRWLGGIFLLTEDDKRQYKSRMNLTNMGMSAPTETLTQNSKTETEGFALFGETTFTFFKKLELTLGLRYDRESKEFNYDQSSDGDMLQYMGYAALDGSEKDTYAEWLPKAVLSYAVSDDIKTYLSASKGFRSGGYNDNSNIGTFYDPEYTWNYELGFKSSWLGNRLRVNGDIFYIDWKDMQVEVITSDGALVYYENAAKAESKGAELQISAVPVTGLELTGTLGYTDAKYEDYVKGSEDYSGNYIQTAPRYTASGGFRYRFSSGFFVSALYSRYGKMYFDAANTAKQDPYGIINAKAGYESEKFDVYLYGRNIADEEYASRGFISGGTWYGRAGEPRVVGAALTYRF